MGTRSVEESHPVDVDNRELVKLQLKSLCERELEAGVSLTDMAARSGSNRGHSFMRILWDPSRNPGFWEWSTFTDLCAGVNAEPEFVLSGVDFGQHPTEWHVSRSMPSWRGMALQKMLARGRVRSEEPIRALADRVGVADSVPWRVENSDSPRLGTLQWYARALGGQVTFVVVERS